jgi:putative ABC transport system permease protein
MLHDLRFALRQFRQNPGFIGLAVFALAIGIGVNTAVFSIVNAVLIRSPPYRDPARIVAVWESNPKQLGEIGAHLGTCLQNYREWRRQNDVFSDTAYFLEQNFVLTKVDRPERVNGLIAATNLFEMLGVNARIGRLFLPEDAEAGRNRVAVLSNGFYERHFGTGSSVIGRTVTLTGTTYTVIGVLPPEFRMPTTFGGWEQVKGDVFVPSPALSARTRDELTARGYWVLARLKPGATFDRASEEMRIIAARTAQQDPQLNTGWSATVVPLAEEQVGDKLRLSLIVLECAVGFVLLIACANVANLLLIKAAGREREIAIRSALGASRGRLARQMLAESLLLSLGGGAAGLLLAVVSLRSMVALSHTELESLRNMSVDFTAMGFTIAVTFLTGILVGLAPAAHALRQDVNTSLKQGGRTGSGGGSGRLRRALVVSEVAMALILLTGSGLSIRSLMRLFAVDPGFRADHLLTLHFSLPPAQYSQKGASAALCRQLLDRLSNLPGVRSAALTSGLPMESIRVSSFRIEGQPAPTRGNELTSDFQGISEGYFAALGMPLLQGRNFTRDEAEKHAGVIILNRALAQRLFPHGDALGEVLLIPQRSVIAGIVADTHQFGLDTAPRPELYYPQRDFSPEVTIAVRTASDPARMSAAIEAQVHALDKDLALFDVMTMEQVIDSFHAGKRFMGTLLAIFASIALLLAAIGLYGVLAYSVSQRTREIGIRMALGAGTREVVRLVVGQSLRLTLVGIAIGLAGAFVLTRLMASLLFETGVHDPLTFGGVALLLVLIAGAASYLPARRASRLDPASSLRTE